MLREQWTLSSVVAEWVSSMNGDVLPWAVADVGDVKDVG